MSYYVSLDFSDQLSIKLGGAREQGTGRIKYVFVGLIDRMKSLYNFQKNSSSLVTSGYCGQGHLGSGRSLDYRATATLFVTVAVGAVAGTIIVCAELLADKLKFICRGRK
jgi:hypothetical protein